MYPYKIPKIRWQKMVYQLLPSFLRTQPIGAFVHMLISSLVGLDAQVNQYGKVVFYRLVHTPKRLHIEKLLNDKFDESDRRIRVVNLSQLEPIWFTQRLEDKPIWFGRQFFITKYKSYRGVDFIIRVPIALKPRDQTELSNLQNRLKAETDYYKELDKTYSVQWID